MTNMRKNKYVQHKNKHCMQYEKASCCFRQQTFDFLPPSLPPSLNPSLPTHWIVFTEDSFPHVSHPHFHTIHSYTYTHTRTHITSNTITSLSLLVWGCGGEALWNSLTLFYLLRPSLGGGCGGLGAVVPLVGVRVVHFHGVEEVVSIESAHSVDGLAQHGRPRVAAWGSHAAQHLPLIAGWVVHLHTAECMRAVKAANDKQFAWRKWEPLHISAP